MAARLLLQSRQEWLLWVHIAIGNLKAYLLGTFHGVSGQYLQEYLNEFVYRFNRRFWEAELPLRLTTGESSMGMDKLPAGKRCGHSHKPHVLSDSHHTRCTTKVTTPHTRKSWPECTMMAG